ncbi:MAG: PTS sugar transporter subunit IIA [Candidatus Igneacidithiobacillus chanchocoensis]
MTMAALPLRVEAILLDTPDQDANGVLGELATLFGVSATMSAETILQALQNREAQGSTALGGGVAVPHARLPGLGHAAVAALRTRSPVDFSAPDGEPVRLFLGVLVPASATMEHLEILSQLATRLARPELRQQLLQVTKPEDFRSLLVGEA